MVIFQEWLDATATGMGTTSQEAGVILSLVFLTAFIGIILIATKGVRGFETCSVAAFFHFILFTYMGWLPLWTGSALAITVAALIANYWRTG